MSDASIREYFLGGLDSLIEDIPGLRGKVEIVQDADGDMAVRAMIPKADEGGFDIAIQVFDGWEVNVFAGECCVDFFLSAKEKHSLHNRQRVDAALELVRGLLGPGYRVRQWYRGELLLRGRVEKREEGRWTLRAWYRRSQWFREPFAPRSHRVFQNRYVETEATWA